MADREQSHTSKPGGAKPQRDQTRSSQAERGHGLKGGDTVGRNVSGKEVPDSKETSTEIAIEEGRKGRSEHPDNKP